MDFYPAPEPENLDARVTTNEFDISDELKERWKNHVQSSYTIDQVIEKLRTKSIDLQNAFVERLNLEVESIEFSNFVTRINKFMDGAEDAHVSRR